MRHENWQTRLSELFRDNETKEFDFPTWNCAIFAADAVLAQTDKDILADIRGKFTDETSAARKIRSIYKVKTVQELFRKQLDTPLKPLAFAKHGDIVFASKLTNLDLPMDTKLFGPVPGVCYGELSYFLGEVGFIKVPTLSLTGSALWVL